MHEGRDVFLQFIFTVGASANSAACDLAASLTHEDILYSIVSTVVHVDAQSPLSLGLSRPDDFTFQSDDRNLPICNF